MSIKLEDKNGTELIEAVTNHTGIDADKVKHVLKGLRSVIIDCIEKGDKSYIYKFISFEPKLIKGRTGVINGTPYTSEDKQSIKVKLSDTVVRDLNA